MRGGSTRCGTTVLRSFRGLEKTVCLSIFCGGLIAGAFSCTNETKATIAEAEQRIRDAGQPLTMEELEAHFPEIPPGQNAALVYQQVFRSGAGGQSYELFKQFEGIDSLPIPADLQTDLSAHVNRCSEESAMLDRAAAMPNARFPLYLGFDVWDPRPPLHHFQLRECVPLDVLRGVFALSEGRPEDFVRSQRSLLRLADSIAYEPCLLSQRFRTHMHERAVSALEQGLCLTPIPTAELLSLQNTYKQAEDQDAMIGAYVGERVGIIKTFEILSEYEPPDPQNSVATMPPTYKPKRIDPKVLDRARLTLLNALEPLTEPSKSSWPELIRIGQETKLRIMAQQRDDDRSYLLVGSNFFGAVEQFGRDIAMLRNAQAAMAVERFRANTGALPDDLGQLVPKYLAAPIEDPFDGQPLRYKRLAIGYQVYSVYADLKDDNGRQANNTDSGFLGDWVFEVRR